MKNEYIGITQHSLPTKDEIIGFIHIVFMQYSQNLSNMINEIIIVAINKNFSRFEHIYFQAFFIVFKIFVHKIPSILEMSLMDFFANRQIKFFMLIIFF